MLGSKQVFEYVNHAFQASHAKLPEGKELWELNVNKPAWRTLWGLCAFVIISVAKGAYSLFI